MPKLAAIILPVNRVITAVCKQVGIGEVAVDAKIGGIIRIDETAYLRIIITILEVVEACLGIVVVPPVADGVALGQGAGPVEEIARSRESRFSHGRWTSYAVSPM